MLPERFDVSFVGPGGEALRPAMLHRAVVGSLERFIGVLLEHHHGVLPAWLAPEQVRVLSVGGAQAYAAAVCESLGGLRASVDAREVSLSRKIAEAHELGVPCVVVAGEREAREQRAVIRDRRGEQRSVPARELAQELARLCSGSSEEAPSPGFGVCCRA